MTDGGLYFDVVRTCIPVPLSVLVVCTKAIKYAWIDFDHDSIFKVTELTVKYILNVMGGRNSHQTCMDMWWGQA